jgi:hypothetical protein
MATKKICQDEREAENFNSYTTVLNETNESGSAGSLLHLTTHLVTSAAILHGDR